MPPHEDAEFTLSVRYVDGCLVLRHIFAIDGEEIDVNEVPWDEATIPHRIGAHLTEYLYQRIGATTPGVAITTTPANVSDEVLRAYIRDSRPPTGGVG